jgi:hypothetical protein|nr:MAG TPA_asm: hypothetical protein [Caudoviricetes sp.]
MRSGFVFYRSWLEAVKNLPREMQGEVLTAIIEYGLDGVTTGSLKPITSAMLAMVKPQIDANNKRLENGLKGGRPRKNKEESEPNNNQTITEEKPNINQAKTKTNPDKPKEKDKVKDIKKETTTSVVEKKAAAKAATIARKEEFYDSLVPYVEMYGKEMVREFFDYWSEMNKSETKMRFEQQPTWEIGRRLSTWAKREKINGNRNYQNQRDSQQRKLNSAVAVATRVQEAAAKKRAELQAEGIID